MACHDLRHGNARAFRPDRFLTSSLAWRTIFCIVGQDRAGRVGSLGRDLSAHRDALCSRLDGVDDSLLRTFSRNEPMIAD